MYDKLNEYYLESDSEEDFREDASDIYEDEDEDDDDEYYFIY